MCGVFLPSTASHIIHSSVHVDTLWPHNANLSSSLFRSRQRKNYADHNGMERELEIEVLCTLHSRSGCVSLLVSKHGEQQQQTILNGDCNFMATRWQTLAHTSFSHFDALLKMGYEFQIHSIRILLKNPFSYGNWVGSQSLNEIAIFIAADFFGLRLFARDGGRGGSGSNYTSDLLIQLFVGRCALVFLLSGIFLCATIVC